MTYKETDNLPEWPGAREAYSRAYRILAVMGRSGHVTKTKIGRRTYCAPSTAMDAGIAALNCGDEEFIKAFNFEHLKLDPKLA